MTLLEFILVLAMVESGMNPHAVGDNGKAVGLLQIHPIMVDDVNRISGLHFSYADRKCPRRSIQMCVIYLRHYERNGTFEQMARSWNGGPSWRTKKEKTNSYVRAVFRRLSATK